MAFVIHPSTTGKAIASQKRPCLCKPLSSERSFPFIKKIKKQLKKKKLIKYEIKAKMKKMAHHREPFFINKKI
ncbi:hypothetical protein PSI23_11965 [Xenorhabdus sp. XENO-10]|uniref:Uncharacterized protein n=1 Tax=Xenorhabdus yunnanensis TaxID=3025878 RepID=A0ABT5LFW5_9GAMM|nr:hypothetical protein [Xenorhabdus yunnanensis]MDC9589997.1 hypothetical protein [Xenorhabdus yunnanensis]